MATTLFPLPRPLSVGEVLDAGFRLFRGTLLACLPYGALAVLAGQLPGIYRVASGRGAAAAGDLDAIEAGIFALSIVLTVGLSSVVILKQHALASGDLERSRGAPIEALHRLVPAVGLVALYLAAVFAGLLLLVVPGLYLATALCFSWPILLIERTGVGQALSGSLRLIGGFWWRTLMIFLAALAALLVFYALAGIVGIVVAALTGPTDFAVMTAVSTVVVIVLGAFGGPFYSALLLAAYEDVKLRKQGADLERRIESIGQA